MTNVEKTGPEASADTRDVIRGCRVESREPATASSPLDKDRKMKVNGIDEVLLSDGSIVYQCVRSKFCFKVFDTVTQATPHLRTHGRPQAAARRDKEIEQERAKREQRSAAGQASQDTRRQRVALLVGDQTRADWLNELVDTLEEALPVLRLLAKITVDVPEPEAPLISPEELADLRAKAAKWDTFRELAS